jgi:hypothetical protein
VQVVIEPVYDLSPGEGGDCCWKRQAVRPVSNSLQVRESLLGSGFFQRVSSTSFGL